MKLFLSPHNDDEALFGAITIMREKPLVVICSDSYQQFHRGTGITADQRWEETVAAMRLLGAPVMRLGLRDDFFDRFLLDEKLRRFEGFEQVFAPALQGGNPIHDLVGLLAKSIWGEKCKHYTTYTPTELHTTGIREIVPTSEELELKNQALACYKSQIEYPLTAPHFEAVKGKSEWFI